MEQRELCHDRFQLKDTLYASQISLPDALGLADIRTGKEVSDQSLEQIFSIASKAGSAVRFLRLGGPKKFRSDVINFISETGGSITITPGYRMLIDKRIKEIEFILTYPYSESFLARMDAEKKSNWDIWRVQTQVLDFARGLLRASEQRELKGISRIKLAFQCTDLVWNLSIAGDQCVVARAYYRSATGHDGNVAEIHLLTGKHSRMAESFIFYYNFVKNDSRTRFIHYEDELNSIENWPSLFKGNPILNPSDKDPQLIEKSCCSIFGEKAEIKWLSCQESKPLSCTYFNPVKLAMVSKRNEPWHGITLCVHKVEGVSASELLWHIQKIGDKRPELIPNLETLAGFIVYQAFRALTEFREVGKNIDQSQSKMMNYPWEKNLKEALSEAGRFLTDNQQELSECIKEASQLGRNLETFASQPFRDAHLKNRMIKIDKKYLTNDYKDFCEFLNKKELEDIFDWLKENTYDIDFETGFWLVSKWDDPLHILWSNSLGINQADELKEGFGLLEKWWSPPESVEDEKVLWMTSLCRSLREYCRRLWYNRVMPITYSNRYHIEQQNHFLDLAMAAASHLDGYSSIKDFLEKCQDHGDDIWNSAINDKSVEPVVAKVPFFIKEYIVSDHPQSTIPINESSPLHGRSKYKYQVAFSFAGEDRRFAEKLAKLLKEKGISFFYDQYNQADLWGKDLYQHLQSVYRDDAQFCVVFLSQAYAQKLWTQHELESAQARAFREHKEYILPVKIDDTEIPGINETIGYIDLRSTSLEKIADMLVKKLSSQNLKE